MGGTTAPAAPLSGTAATTTSASVAAAPGASHRPDDDALAQADGTATSAAADPSSLTNATTPLVQQAAASAAAPTPATPESAQISPTIANLSAQIAQQAGQKTSRFDVQLTPDGMGRVDVAVQIDASGAVTASLSFEKADSAALVKDQSGALQTALASAGLSLSPDSLKISHVQADGSSLLTAAAQQTVAGAASASGAGAQSGGQNAGQNAGQNTGQNTGQSGAQSGQHSLASGGQSFESGGHAGGQSGQQDRPTGSTFAARSFQAAVSAADVVDRQTAYASSLSTRGLDIRI